MFQDLNQSTAAQNSGSAVTPLSLLTISPVRLRASRLITSGQYDPRANQTGDRRKEGEAHSGRSTEVIKFCHIRPQAGRQASRDLCFLVIRTRAITQ